MTNEPNRWCGNPRKLAGTISCPRAFTTCAQELPPPQRGILIVAQGAFAPQSVSLASTCA